MHCNVSFKKLSNDQLKNYALKMLQLYKECLLPLSINIEKHSDKIYSDLLHSQEQTFRQFIYRNRNIQKQSENLDLQISPDIKSMIFTSQYYIAEIDIDTDGFKEMTLLDMDRMGMIVVVDLTVPQVEMVKSMKLEEGNIIIATIISSISTIGQTEEWNLLNIHDVCRLKIKIEDLDKFIKIV